MPATGTRPVARTSRLNYTDSPWPIVPVAGMARSYIFCDAR